MDRSYLIDQADINAIRGPLKTLLELELHKGNCICETWRGDWPYPSVTVISLRHPFRAQFAENAPSVIFKEVNDPIGNRNITMH